MRKAFTLIELLIVVAIVGGLVALLLPAIQAAREAARRSQCGNNLRQQGIALQSYHGVYRVFPAAYYVDFSSPGLASPTNDAPNGWAWGAMILPFAEGNALFDQFQLNLPCWAPDNQTATQTPVPMFICPSATGSNLLTEVRNGAGATLANFSRSTYVASAGQDEPWGYAAREYANLADGPFFRNSRVRIADVPDGLSQTVFLGEHTSALSAKTWVGVVPGAIVCPVNTIRFPMTACDYAATLVNCHSGPAWDEIDPITGFAPIHPPNSPLSHVCQMYSDHLTGANVTLGDGSVRFISREISHPTWAALSSRNKGDRVGEF